MRTGWRTFAAGVVTLAALGGSVTPLRGTEAVELRWSELVARADVVARVRVRTRESAWGTWQGRPAIVTRHLLEPLEVLSGEAPRELTLFGGAVGDERMTLVGQPDLMPGDEVFLFALRRAAQCPLVGVWQGVFWVRRGRIERDGRPLVDVVEDWLVWGEDRKGAGGARGLTAKAFAQEVRRTLALLAEDRPPPKLQAGLRRLKEVQ